MKKIFSLAAFAFVSVAAFAQEIEFKVDFKENTTYVQKTVNDMNMVISHPSEGTFEQPLNTVATYTFKTGKKAANGDVPFTGNFKVESEAVAEQAEDMSNNTFTGHINNGNIVIDDVTAPKLDMVQAGDIKQGILKALNQFTINKKLKVGESFTVNNLPSSLGAVEMDTENIVLTYTLKKVEGNTATFDILLKDSTFDINSQGINMTCKMNMTGILTYLTDKKYVASQELNTHATLATSADLGITVQMDGKTVQTTTPSTN